MLLLADLELRTALWIDERDHFRLLLMDEVRDLQRVGRLAVAREQQKDHERLAHHFVGVTHVVKIHEQSCRVLVGSGASGASDSRRSGS